MDGDRQGRLPELTGKALGLESCAFLEPRCWLSLTNGSSWGDSMEMGTSLV